MSAALSGLAKSAGVFRSVFADANLWRIEVAFVGFNVAEYSTWIAMLVFAYGVGGTTASGIVGAVQLVPAALLAPFASSLGDRYPRNRVLLISYLAQALSMCLTGVAMVDRTSVIAIYALAAVTATTITVTRPVQCALLPSVADTPSQLIASNVAAGWVEGLGILAGPLITGVLLAVSTPGTVFLLMGGVLLCSALLVVPVATPRVVPTDGNRARTTPADRELWRGFRTVATESRPRLVVSLMAANFLLFGAIDILVVVLSIQLVGFGPSGVGYLTAAFGLGGLIGAMSATVLTARQTLAPVLLGAAIAWAVGLTLLGIVPSRALAPLLIVIAGTGKPLIDVVGRILLQRVVPDRVLSRVFGVVEGLSMAAAAVGTIFVPVLVALVGPRLSFVAFGIFLPLLALSLWRGLTDIDEEHSVAEERLPWLRSLPIFAPLPAQELLRIAERLVPLTVPAGAVLIREGDPGDRFYVIGEGEVSVSIGNHVVGTQGNHDFFGEIALLRDTPRTATVTAKTTTTLFALDRQDFLQAVTGHAQSMEAAQAVSRARIEDHAAE